MVVSLTTRVKFVLLSVISMSLILAIVYITTLGLYSRSLMHSIDEGLEDDLDRVKQRLNFTPQGKLELYAQPASSQFSQGHNRQIMYLIRDNELNAIRRSASMIFIEPPNVDLSITDHHDSYQSFSFSDREYRTYHEKYTAGQHAGDEDLYIQLVRPLDEYHEQVNQLLNAMLWLIPVPLILISLGSWWIADRALRPLARLSNTLTNIDSEQLDVRVEVENQNDEVGKIAQATNTFLDRIENSFNSLKRFTSDASHELRTPLTTIRTQAEVLLSRERSREEYKQVLGSVLEEVDRLEYLSEALLQLTRGDAGILKLDIKQHDISVLLNNWVENLLALAEEKQIRFKLSIPRQIIVKVDIAIFERIYINIIQNAIAYTPKGGEISISLTKEAQRIIFQVADTGPGVADQDKLAIFQRFTRLDSTRQQASGAGLGLAITQWAVELHNGSISVTDNISTGAVFIVVIPI